MIITKIKDFLDIIEKLSLDERRKIYIKDLNEGGYLCILNIEKDFEGDLIISF